MSRAVVRASEYAVGGQDGTVAALECLVPEQGWPKEKLGNNGSGHRSLFAAHEKARRIGSVGSNFFTFTWEVPMRYLRKYLQQVGLVSTMLIGGVLGGMLAPPPSDAETRPTVTFQVDTGTVSANLLNTSGTGLHGSTCTIPPGFSACYTLQTNGQFSGTNSKGVQRTFTIVNYDVTATPTTTGLPARVLVTDSGLLSVDIIKFSQVEVAPYPVTTTNNVRNPVSWGTSGANTGAGLPPPNYGEVHNLQFVITHRFDWNPNTATTTANNARYAFGMRFAGLFKGNLTGASASNDFAKFTGVGQFGSDTTETPLSGSSPGSPTPLRQLEQ